MSRQDQGAGVSTIAETLRSGRRSVSFEFFPPKTDRGEQLLWQAIRELEPLRPTFVSVTYGAGGSTRDRTIRVTSRIAAETRLRPVGHLTTIGADRAELGAVIKEYGENGVHSLLALRGDPPQSTGETWEPGPDGLRHALDLVRLVKESSGFEVGVAAFPERHPESPDLEHDAKVLAMKAEAGADFAVTQFFFRAVDYFALVDRAARYGCDIPVIPGIMPVTNLAQIERFAQLSGADLPSGLVQRLRASGEDPDEVRRVGVAVATDLCRELLDGGAPGLHFYTLNRSTATREIYQALADR